MPARRNNLSSPYVWGLSGLADYMGISRATLWRIRHSNTRTLQERKLLCPRIVDGQAAFRKSNIDLFMAPEMTPVGATITDPFPHE